jgi:hypothetical protein
VGPLLRAIEEQRQPKLAKLLPRDQRRLIELVDHYGAELIAAAVREVQPPRKRGRPTEPPGAKLAKMRVADWIEATAEEYRPAGTRDCYQKAYLDYLKAEDQEGDREVYREVWKSTKKKRSGVLQRLQTLKKYHHAGRRYWIELSQLQQVPEWVQRFTKKGK